MQLVEDEARLWDRLRDVNNALFRSLDRDPDAVDEREPLWSEQHRILRALGDKRW